MNNRTFARICHGLLTWITLQFIAMRPGLNEGP